MAHWSCLPDHQNQHSVLLDSMKEPHRHSYSAMQVLQVAGQTYSRILKQRCPANYNTRICLSIYLDFLYTRWDVGCCEPCYLRPVWHGLVRTGHTVPCCINAGVFILRTHNDAAVPVPKASLFSRPPPFLHETWDLAGSRCHLCFECFSGALDARVRVWEVFKWCRLHIQYIYTTLR